MDNNLVLYYQNVHGLRSKVDLLHMNIGLLSPIPDVIYQGINDAELGLTNYSIIRRDRPDMPVLTTGGGVMIAIRDGLKFKVIDTDNSIEQLYIEITNLSQKLIVRVFYPAHRSDSDGYIKYISTVEYLKESHLSVMNLFYVVI